MMLPQCAAKLPCSSIVEVLIEAACVKSRVIRETLAVYGDSSLSEYVDGAALVAGDPFQSRDDVIDVVYRYVTPLLGGAVAGRVCGELEICPIALTTNHHGVDFFAQSVQGSLIFSQRTVNGRRAQTVPIFACGGIPLDNLTYPQGILLYHGGRDKLESTPRKLPIFSNKMRRQTTSMVAPIQKAMIDRAHKLASKMVFDHELSPSLLTTLQQILNDDYASPSVIRLPTYSKQAVVLNHRIWKRLFAHPAHAPDIVYLELEKIASSLLKRDLLNPYSLTSCAIMEPKCREEIIEGLDGVAACWQRSTLMDRLLGCHGTNQGAVSKYCGTMFFWAINDQCRKVPLCLVKSATGDLLRGIDDKGRQFEFPFQPEALVDGLHEKKLLPSLFTCFMTLSLAHGVTCLGGYYQAEYLPRIQYGLAAALRRCGGHHDIATRVEGVHTTGYLGGMQAVTLRLEQNRMGPAGPAEIIASGGLTDEDFEKIRACTVRDVHIASLFETIPDLGLGHIGPANWRTELASDCGNQLSRRVVCKSLDSHGVASNKCGFVHAKRVLGTGR